MNASYARARAHATSQRWPEAERDYRDVLSRQKGSQYNLAGPLSHAALARALAAQGNDAKRARNTRFLDALESGGRRFCR